MKITIPVAVEAPTLAQIEAWLVRHGWQHRPDWQVPDWATYAHAVDRLWLTVPLRVSALDYPRRLTELVEDLALLTGIAPADLVAQMREGR